MIDNYMLFKELPTIDLHGNDRYQAVILTKEFINDNIKQKNKNWFFVKKKVIN